MGRIFLRTDATFPGEENRDETRYRGTFRWNDHYLFIVYMVQGDAVRIISARVATKGEIEHYYERGK